MDEFSGNYLFDPLQIEKDEWTQYPGEIFVFGGSLKITPRHMLKLGVTCLNGGVWNDKRIVSADWIEKSSTRYGNNTGIKIPIEDSGKNDYGYTWWISELDHKGRKTKMFRANSWGGQAIMVFPEPDMVVVFTGGNYGGQ